MAIISYINKHVTVAVIEIYSCTVNNGHWINDGVIVYLTFFMMPTLLFSNRGVTIRWATIWYISRYTTHDTVYDTIKKNSLYIINENFFETLWDMCHQHDQYSYVKTVLLARYSEFKTNKVVCN